MSAPEIDDGGPAFPVPGLPSLPNGEFIYPTGGMSLRAYLMAHAPASEIKLLLPGMQTAGAFLGLQDCTYDPRVHGAQVLAKARRMWADAMLAAMEDGQ